MGYRCANCNQPLFLGSLLEPKDARIAALGAERDALAARVAALHNHLRELCEVAHLRGDDNLPHPADDPRMWTARMQTAWDEANTLLDSTPAADLEAHDARVRREALEAAWERMGHAPDPHDPGFFVCNHITVDRWYALRAAILGTAPQPNEQEAK